MSSARTDMHNKRITVYSVGDVVRHRATGKQGQIVRLVNLSDITQKPTRDQENESAYIVSLPGGWLTPAREALWMQSDVDEKATPPSDNVGSESGTVDTPSEE